MSIVSPTTFANLSELYPQGPNGLKTSTVFNSDWKQPLNKTDHIASEVGLGEGIKKGNRNQDSTKGLCMLGAMVVITASAAFSRLNTIKEMVKNHFDLLVKRLTCDKRRCFTTIALIASGGALVIGVATGSMPAMCCGFALQLPVAFEEIRRIRH